MKTVKVEKITPMVPSPQTLSAEGTTPLIFFDFYGIHPMFHRPILVARAQYDHAVAVSAFNRQEFFGAGGGA